MQLNESTYETIFLLYIDKELNPKERLEVEAFIAGNPNYALEMEALKATVLNAENIPYAFKENLKQQEAETSVEDLGKNWEEDLDQDWGEDLKATYATILKENMQAIPGLSASFKNTLKKATDSEGILIKSFGFNQHKFIYATIAACLMVFIGYQQLTNTSVSNSQAANSLVTNSNTVLVTKVAPITTTTSGETVANNSSQIVSNIEPIAIIKQIATTKLQASKSSNQRSSYKFQNESIAIVEPAYNNSNLNHQAIITKLSSSYNNPMTMDALPTETNTIDVDTEPTIDEKVSTSYEVIDTEDPNRTIFIANFEIDGNKLRGLKRKVTSLFKNNKSERNK
jgi:hypothetical protein